MAGEAVAVEYKLHSSKPSYIRLLVDASLASHLNTCTYNIERHVWHVYRPHDVERLDNRINTHWCEQGPDRFLFKESYVYWFLEEKHKTPVLWVHTLTVFASV